MKTALLPAQPVKIHTVAAELHIGDVVTRGESSTPFKVKRITDGPRGLLRIVGECNTILLCGSLAICIRISAKGAQ